MCWPGAAGSARNADYARVTIVSVVRPGPPQIVRFWMPLGLGLNLVTNRVGVYLALMDDRYPSTDDHQSSILTTSIPMPNVISTRGSRW